MLVSACPGRPASAHVRRLLAALVAAAGVYALPMSGSATASGLVVTPWPSTHPGLSYFKLTGRPGVATPAGSIALQNRTGRRMRVAIAPVAGETLSTLGSSYAPAGPRPRGPTRWVRPGLRATTLAPGARAIVPVTVAIPSAARPGDYLSGVSIEELGQRPQRVKRGRVSIASVSRYVIGVETTLPGRRRPLIRFTGATVRRQPAGVSFALIARNPGNVILQGVHGEARITRSGHLVVAQRIEPGTFVAHTRIAYPVNAFRESPAAGTRYRVTAWMRYRGGIARLNTTVTFGHQMAVVQQQYGGPPATSGGTTWWKVAGFIAIAAYALLTTGLLLRRRQRASRSPVGS